MEVLPRLSKIPPPQQVIIEPEPEPQKEEVKSEQPSDSRFSSWLTIAFVAVIIILAGLIIYLVSRNEKYMGWIRGAPKSATPAPAPVQPKISNQTAEIVETVSNDELLKFQAMLSADKPQKEVVIDESANTVKTITEIDAKTKESLTSQINQNAVTPEKEKQTIIDENIIESMNKDVEQLEKSNETFVPIEQFSTKQSTSVKTYYSKQEIVDMSYDYDEIIKCCNEEIPRYKGYKWVYKKPPSDS
jgi:hypothetical protein